MSKCTLNSLNALIASRKPTLLNKVGFEDRSIAASTLELSVEWQNILTLTSTNRSERAEENLQKMKASMKGRGQEFKLIGELEQGDPLEAQRVISDALSVVLKEWSTGELWIDYTALRREELLILVNLLVERCDSSKLSNIYGLYVSAEKMGEWLSGDVVEIRSVVGYPGEISPSRSTTLIVLMGFETNRTRAIIEAYEPSHVLLGMPALGESINQHLFERNADVLKRVSEDFGPLISDTFEFSANDPIKAVTDLQVVIDSCGDNNIVLAPLHTKISTIAAGVIARKEPKIQICYAAVDDYNEETYSQAGEDVYLIPFSFLKKE